MAQGEGVTFRPARSDDLPYLRSAIEAHLSGRTSHLEVEQRMRHRIMRVRSQHLPKFPRRIAGAVLLLKDHGALELGVHRIRQTSSALSNFRLQAPAFADIVPRNPLTPCFV